ncbi:MAG: hypothetical protein AAF581_11385 [Planctomycetota bacterium]
MKRHPVNFAPLEWRPQPTADPRRSLLLSGALAFLLMVTALSFQAPEPAAAEAQELPVEPIEKIATQVRVEAGSLAAIELWRAQEYLPWHLLLADLPSYLGDSTRIDSVTYSAKARTLDLSGQILDVARLPGLMLRLDELAWLADPNPLSVEYDERTRHTGFTLRLNVVPMLQLEEDR